MSKNFHVFTCQCCDTDYLVDFKDQTFELLTASATVDDWIEDEEDDVILEPDLDQDLEEDEITAEPEPGFKTDPAYSTNTNFKKSYANGTPMVPGKTSEDGQKIVNKPVTGYGSGIRVETQMSTTPPKGVRQQRSKLQLQPPGNAKPFAPRRKKASELTDADHSRDGLEISGDDATQDFTGLTGAEAHFDNLMQQAYETDLRTRGF